MDNQRGGCQSSVVPLPLPLPHTLPYLPAKCGKGGFPSRRAASSAWTANCASSRPIPSHPNISPSFSPPQFSTRLNRIAQHLKRPVANCIPYTHTRTHQCKLRPAADADADADAGIPARLIFPSLPRAYLNNKAVSPQGLRPNYARYPRPQAAWPTASHQHHSGTCQPAWKGSTSEHSSNATPELVRVQPELVLGVRPKTQNILPRPCRCYTAIHPTNTPYATQPSIRVALRNARTPL